MQWIRRHESLAAWIITAAVMILGFGGIALAEIRNPASVSGFLSSGDINTYSELNTIVSDVTLTHNGLIDTESEVEAILTDVTDLFTNNDTIGVANGGTGATSLTSNAVLTGNGTSAVTAESNLYFDGTTLGIGTTTPWSGLGLNVYGRSIVVDELATSSLATVVIDWTEGNQQTITMSQATQVEFENVHDGGTIRLVLCSDATGRAVSWNVSNLLWTGGTEPTETAATNKCDIFAFVASSGTSTPIVMGSSVLNF